MTGFRRSSRDSSRRRVAHWTHALARGADGDYDRQDEVHCARKQYHRKRLAEAHNSPQSGNGQFCHPGAQGNGKRLGKRRKPTVGRNRALARFGLGVGCVEFWISTRVENSASFGGPFFAWHRTLGGKSHYLAKPDLLWGALGWRPHVHRAALAFNGSFSALMRHLDGNWLCLNCETFCYVLYVMSYASLSLIPQAFVQSACSGGGDTCNTSTPRFGVLDPSQRPARKDACSAFSTRPVPRHGSF